LIPIPGRHGRPAASVFSLIVPFWLIWAYFAAGKGMKEVWRHPGNRRQLRHPASSWSPTSVNPWIVDACRASLCRWPACDWLSQDLATQAAVLSRLKARRFGGHHAGPEGEHDPVTTAEMWRGLTPWINRLRRAAWSGAAGWFNALVNPIFTMSYTVAWAPHGAKGAPWWPSRRRKAPNLASSLSSIYTGSAC